MKKGSSAGAGINNNVKIVMANKTWEKSKEIILPLYVIPRVGELFQYNGIRYNIENVIHHYKEGFNPYIELIVRDIDEAEEMIRRWNEKN